MLGGEALQDFDKLSIQNTGTKNAHLKFIKEGLLGSFPSTDALSKKKGVIRHAMHKPCKILFKWFVTYLKELNNYLPLFPGSSASKNMLPKELNNIILHAVWDGWAKQVYLHGWNFEMKSYKATYDMFKKMEVAETFYKGFTHSKKLIRVDTNRDIHGRKQKIGEDASPTNPE